MEYDEIAAKRRKKLKRAFVYAPFAPSRGNPALPVPAEFTIQNSKFIISKSLTTRALQKSAKIRIFPLTSHA